MGTPISTTYRLAMTVCGPAVRWWGRLEVSGLEHVPASATVVCVAVRGTVALVRFPRRPRISVRFFPPSGGPLAPGETPEGFTARLVREIRAEAPWVAAGRDPNKRPLAAAKW